MVVAVFRARRTEIGLGEQDLTALKQMEEPATKMPGHFSRKAYVAEDGERRPRPAGLGFSARRSSRVGASSIADRRIELGPLPTFSVGPVDER